MNNPNRWSSNQFTNYTLRTKLIIAFLLVALIPLGVLGFLNTSATRDRLVENANQSLFAAASQTAASLDTFINTTLDTIEVEAQLPDMVEFLSAPSNQQPGGADLRATLRSLSLKDQENILSYGLLNAEGRNVADSDQGLISTDESGDDYFQIPLQTNETYISPVRFEESEEAVLYFSSPVRDALGEVIGVLRVRYDAAILQDLVEQGNRLATEGLQPSIDSNIEPDRAKLFAILLDENHIRLADVSEPGLRFKSVVPLDPARLEELKARGQLPDLPPGELATDLPDFDQGLINATPEQPNFTGTAHPGAELEQGAVVKLTTQDWFLVFVQARSAFLAPVEEQTRNTIFFAVVITAVVVAAAIIVAQLLTRPIARLTVVAQQVATGDLRVQAPVETQDEIGQLAIAFNSMTNQLHHLLDSLESQVHERTAELALSMEVGRRAALIKELDQLLPTITEFIRESFDFYYVQVYLLDDLGQHLALRAGTGSVGQQLLETHHSVSIEEDLIVCWAATQGEAIVVSDTQEIEILPPNPLLPETQSELALPLIVEGRVIGVLDMQNNQVDTFTPNNLIVFEAMATQLAIAIDSAQQWVLAQEAQQKAGQAIRQLTHENWDAELTALRSKQNLGFTYDLMAIMPLSDFGPDPTNGDGIEVQSPAAMTQSNGLTVPLIVQNQSIGRFAVTPPAHKTWSEDEQALLEAVAQQLAQKAENLRLFEQTQQRATREQIARQITDKIRASRNIETALKTAAEELAKALGTAKAVIDLKVASPSDETGPDRQPDEN